VAASATRNGIDFVTVSADQRRLDVTFLNALDLTATGPESVTITGGDVVPTVAVQSTTYTPATATARPALRVVVAAPGDFSWYTLTLASPELDPYFAAARFSFKANCDTGFDCRTPDGAPEPPPGGLPPIDYLAKDYASFRQALLDFSAGRYPGWRERSPADFGVMMLEALCAVADDLSYLQDRVHNEAAIESATERLSVTRLARLVDYDPRPATAARVRLCVNVEGDTSVPAGYPVTALTPDGRRLTFEVGRGLIDPATGRPRAPESFPLSAARNELTPHPWDTADECLRAGSREVWVVGTGHGFQAGEQLLIETDPAVVGNPPTREWVTLAAPQPGDEADDPLPAGGGPPVGVTRLRFDGPTVHDHHLPRTKLHGNVVPATQGRTVSGDGFAIPGAATPAAARQAIWRTGPRGDDGRAADQFLYPLDAIDRVAWLVPEAGRSAVPELALTEQTDGGPEPWVWRRWLLGAERFDKAFTLDPARYRRVPADPGQPASFEYDGDGDTIRFGFRGLCDVPSEGARFELTYRVADGAAGNVPADTVTGFDPALAPGVRAVTNPFPAEGGDEAEPLAHVRDHAPQQFRAERLRAVRPNDYRRAAEELPWVQRAGATFRWTGSWLTGFVAVDPVGGREPSAPQSLELTQLLNRRRLAGYEVYAMPPRYVALDLHVEVCAAPHAVAGHVADSLRRALASTPGAFFDPDHFTFGTPLRRSALEAAVQAVPGVVGVVCVRVRRRGQTDYQEMGGTVAVGVHEIIRVAGDPNRPDRGRVDLVVRGGR
jgi:hypothetical protein